MCYGYGYGLEYTMVFYYFLFAGVYFVFIMSVGKPHTRLSGIKQDLLDFKNEIDSVLVNIKTEMRSKFDDVNKTIG